MEKPFKETDAREILSRCGIDDYITIDKRGVWPIVKRDLSMRGETELMRWRPARVFKDDENAPDVSDTPGLPLPFDARDLTAFMVDGIGTLVVEFYGGWKDGPDPIELDLLGSSDTKAKDAVTQAFNVYREAKAAVTQEPDEAPETDAMVRYLLAPLTSPAPVVADSASGDVETDKAGPGWSLKTSLQRAPGYRWPLYQVLKDEHAAGKPCPSPRDVLNIWGLNPPPDLQVMPDGVKYNNGLGHPKEADLKAIGQAIKNLMK